MAYKPKVQSVGGPKGKAKVQVKEDRIRVVLVEELKDGSTKEYTAVIDKENCPEDVVIKPGTYYAALSGDLKKLYQIHPWSGMFEGHVKNFASQKDKAPAPRIVSGGVYGDYGVFNPIIEITSKEAEGMTVSYQLPYNFGEDQEEINGEMKSVVMITHPKSRFTEKLVDFLDITGVWEKGPLPYSDNVLPKLEKRMIAMDRHFKFIIKDGWVDSIYEPSNLPENEDVDTNDETAPF